MDWSTIISAIVGLVGSGVGALSGILISSKLVDFRLQQIENKLPNIDKISNAQTEMQAELDNVMSIGADRRRRVEELETKVERLNQEVAECQKQIELIQQEIRMYHQGNLGK